MSKEWPKAKLGDVLFRVDRFEPREELTEYPFAGTYSFARGIFVGERKLGSTFALPKIQRIRGGDFIYCKIMAWEGAFGVAPKEADNCVMSGAFVVYELNRDRIDEKFLDYFFKVPDHWQSIGSQSTGTNVRRQSLHPTQFERAEIPLPPLAEQRRVVVRVEELAAQIHEAHTLRHRAAEEAEALQVASIADCFARAGEPRPLAGTDSCEIICGQHLNPEEQAESGIPYMTGPADFGKRVAVPSRYARFARALAQPGDVLLTVKGAGVGKTNLAPATPVAIGRQLYALRPKSERIDQIFLYYALQDGLRHFREAMTATTVPGIGRSDVEGLGIPFPPLAEQRRIVAELDVLQAKVDALKRLQAETAAELDALLPAILDKAFKGEL